MLSGLYTMKGNIVRTVRMVGRISYSNVTTFTFTNLVNN